ncbi:MAG: hypothetical protein ISR00_07220 [Flavobacteriales bacterium]|nr:hypothetical protein [Flavobacteriales bacterium]MBL6873713.1 hypothetical protein [Flavobacteriales bacterium]
MKSSYIKAITLLFAFFLTSCDTPKSLTKKGDKFSEKSLYADACQFYMQALNQKGDFIEAKEGLRLAGQKQVNIHLDNFFKSKNFGEERQAIYHYRDASSLKSKIATYSIQIDIPQTYTSDYNTLVDNYVATNYDKAIDLLEEEKFAESEKLLKEITLLKPNFKDVESMKNVATFEPIYRSANEFLELEKFRSAYYEFEKIPASYKECESRKALALEAGLLSIGIMEFKNSTRQRGGESAISALITEELIQLDNPFIKIVDRQQVQSLIDEQLLGMSGQVSENTSAQAGALIGAKAMLNGKLVSYSKQEQAIQKSTKKAWLERKIRKYNDETEKYYYETVYDKITYNEYYGNASVQVGFQFQLLSTESGEILLTKLININKNDELHFAESNHDFRNIVPGSWRWENKESPNDVIKNSFSDKRALKQLFRNKKTLMSITDLSNAIYSEIAKDVSEKINNYNPENE